MIKNQRQFAPDGGGLAPVEHEELGLLPSWDLGDLYASVDDPAIERDVASAQAAAEAFAKDYRGNLAGLDAAGILAAISKLEAIYGQLGKVISFAQLNTATDKLDAKLAGFEQNMMERYASIAGELVFFDLEFNAIDEAVIEAWQSDPAVARYAGWFRRIRGSKPFQLSEELERYINESRSTSGDAWSRLFDETMAAMEFHLDDQVLNNAQAFERLADPSADKRHEAAKEIGRVLGNNARVLTMIMNMRVKAKETEDRWRTYDRPVSSRNQANDVEDPVVDALASAVTNAFPRLSHRYFAIKAKWMGKDKLAHWDRNAPLPQADTRKVTWERAKADVLAAYGDFDPKMAALGAQFFDNPWIDVPPRANKDGGAFAHPTVTSAHPYLMLNYQGRVRDVMTLAHELGHGVHQLLAREQGEILADTPLTVAETASVFGEMLTFQRLLAQTDDPALRKVMIAGKVEDMLNTVVRQIAFHNFETRVHDARKAGELTNEDMCQIWLDVQHESLGPVFEFDEEYKHYWSYIPHFIHVPFYVYAYAFGDCLVNSLYAIYQAEPEGFADKYFALLSAGGSQRYDELLAPFGLDARDPTFWDKGLAMIEDMIDQLEAMDS